MYLHIDEIILVQDQGKARPDDPVIYERRSARGTRLFMPDGTASPKCGPARRYGVLYQDAGGRWCVVPDTWDKQDAALARMALPAQGNEG